MENETNFVDGFMFKRPHENAPDFIKGCMSVKVDTFIEFIKKHENNGWVNWDLKKSKGGKLYCQLNTYSKQSDTASQAQNEPVSNANPEDDTDNISF